MDDLVAFLRARFDDDAAAVRDCLLSGESNVSTRDLADVDAKQRVLAEYAAVAENDIDEPYEYAYGWANGLGRAVRLLALPYAGHPNYRDEWRP